MPFEIAHRTSSTPGHGGEVQRSTYPESSYSRVGRQVVQPGHTPGPPNRRSIVLGECVANNAALEVSHQERLGGIVGDDFNACKVVGGSSRCITVAAVG